MLIEFAPLKLRNVWILYLISWTLIPIWKEWIKIDSLCLNSCPFLIELNKNNLAFSILWKKNAIESVKRGPILFYGLFCTIFDIWNYGKIHLRCFKDKSFYCWISRKNKICIFSAILDEPYSWIFHVPQIRPLKRYCL